MEPITLFARIADPAGVVRRLREIATVEIDGADDSWTRAVIGFGDGEDEEDADAVWPRVVGTVSVTEPLGAAMHERSRPKAPDEENEDAEPSTAERVARRALALTAVTARAILEQDTANPEAADTYK